jgi:hypothetical protein
VSHFYQAYFGFPELDLNLDCGLRHHEVHIKLGMIFAPYHHGESEPSDDKNDHHIDRVKVKEKDKKYGENRDAQLVEFVDQYMSPLAPKTWIM